MVSSRFPVAVSLARVAPEIPISPAPTDVALRDKPIDTSHDWKCVSVRGRFDILG